MHSPCLRGLFVIAALLAGFTMPAQQGRAEPVAAEVPAVPVQDGTFSSNAMASDIGYQVYLPGAYDDDAVQAFPVVYWLHGSSGFPPGVVGMLAARFDSAIAAGEVPAMIVVFPDGLGESMWLDSKDGSVPMEAVIVHELVPHIDTEFRTVATAQGRIIEGGSMGGYGAARLGLKYPGLFGAISMLNAGPLQEVLDVEDAPIAGRAGALAVLERVYGGDLDYFRAQSPWALAEQNADAVRDRLMLRQIVGEQDPMLETNRRFSQHLAALGIAHTFEVLPGAGHSPREMFAALGEGYWEFFRHAFDQIE